MAHSVATLAFDCPLSDKFHGELTSALHIIGSGDMASARMIGERAGEIGQPRLLPSSYDKYVVDFDGDDRRDLVNSVPDVFVSTANYLKGHGWQRGNGWIPSQPNFSPHQAMEQGGSLRQDHR